MTSLRVPLRAMVELALAALLVAGLAACGKESPRTFRTPEKAVEALASALGGDGSDTVENLFGEGSLPYLRSGDPVADKQDMARIVGLIKEGVTYDDLDDHTKVANFGADPWPFPFPLVSDQGKWHFDLEGGIEELHNRRIGRNELSTLATMHVYVDAQREYYRARPMGDPPVFAQKFRSDEGTRNGLYWPTAEGEEPSPLGDLVAQAASEGYGVKERASYPEEGEAAADEAAAEGDGAADGDGAAEEHGPAAFHGYRYRILTGQSKNAAPGELSYLDAEGRMTSGFAAIAWPVSYGNSGIMTFIVNQRGIVFQKDLGPETVKAVEAITVYDPDETWSPTGD